MLLRWDELPHYDNGDFNDVVRAYTDTLFKKAESMLTMVDLHVRQCALGHSCAFGGCDCAVSLARHICESSSVVARFTPVFSLILKSRSISDYGTECCK